MPALHQPSSHHFRRRPQVCNEEDYEEERLGLQHVDLWGRPAKGESWWIKCPDANSFRQLHNLLVTVTSMLQGGSNASEAVESEGPGRPRVGRSLEALTTNEEDTEDGWSGRV